MEDKRTSQNNKLNQKPGKPRFGFSWILYLLIIVLIGFLFFNNTSEVPEISWKTFKDSMLLEKDVAKLEVINNSKVNVFIKQDSLKQEKQYSRIKEGQIAEDAPVPGPHFFFTIGTIETFEEKMNKAEEDLAGEHEVEVYYKEETNWLSDILIWIIPIGLIFLFWIFIMGRMTKTSKGMGGSMFNMGKSKAEVYDKGQRINITFDDVAGLDEAKEEIIETVKFLKNPKNFTRLGVKVPKGVLLSGPPGTGKTLLAKAVAGEANVPFFSSSGSQFIEMFVGVGASRIRDLFEKAKSRAPSIIFIDELETIGRQRSKAQAFHTNDERENTLNQLLTEMDGFSSKAGVIVIAATNRPDVMDSALLRPGRFDRQIQLDLPNLVERKSIFEVHMQPLRLADDVDPGFLSAQTPGFSGADIANICNEAGIIAARNGKDKIERIDFMNAIDRVVAGLEKKSRVIKPEEKHRVALHEAGHATTSWFLKHANPLLKVSIIPRGKSLGAAWYLPEEKSIMTESQLLDQMCAALGGRASEEIFLNEISSNALDDLEKVTKQAYSMVVNYGLGHDLKNISYFNSTGEESFQKPYSEKTAEKIDKEVQRLVNEAYERTRTILNEHKTQVKQLADLLIKKEVVYKEDVEEIMGKSSKSIAEKEKEMENVNIV